MRALLPTMLLALLLLSTIIYSITSIAEVCPDNCNADIVFLIDRGGSMAAEFAGGQSKYEVAVNGVIDILNSTCTDGRFWIGIVEYWFRSDNITYTGPSSNGTLFNVSSRSVVDDLIFRIESRSSIPPVGISLMGYGIGNATNVLSTGRESVNDYIILISDGLTEQDPWDQVNRARSMGIKIISIFIGDPSIGNDELLRSISDVFINISNPDMDVGSAFLSVYDSVCPVKTPVLVGGLIVDDKPDYMVETLMDLVVTASIIVTILIVGVYISRSLK